MPKLIIGVPCYNEGNYIRDCLRSLANNDLSDVGVVVSDNCSQDQTGAEIQSFLEALPPEKKEHFVLRTNSETKTATANFSSLFEESDSEFFLWVGGHDAVTTNFISACLEEMVSNPSVAMVTGKALGTDERATKVFDVGVQYDFAQKEPLERYMASIKKLSNCTVFHSIFRRSALEGFEFDEKCPSGDHVLISRLLWHGQLRYKPEAGYIRRYFEAENRRRKANAGAYVNQTNTSAFFECYLKDFAKLVEGQYPEEIEGQVKGLIFSNLCQRFGLPSTLGKVA